MNIDNQAWARIGKALTGLSLLLSVLVGLDWVWEKYTEPSVVAVIEQVQAVPSPESRKAFLDSYSATELKGIVERDDGALRQKPLEFRELMHVVARPKPVANLDWGPWNFGSSYSWRVVVKNNSGKPAKDVKLVLPGKGKADFARQYGSFKLSEVPREWTEQLSLGTIPADGKVELMIWLDDSPMGSLTSENTAVLHDSGFGTVREMHSFYGWDADFVAWYLEQNWFIRYGLALLGLLLVAFVSRFIWFQVWKHGAVVAAPSALLESKRQ